MIRHGCGTCGLVPGVSQEVHVDVAPKLQKDPGAAI